MIQGQKDIEVGSSAKVTSAPTPKDTGSSAKVTSAPTPKDTGSTASVTTPMQTGVTPVQPKTDNSTVSPVPKTEYKSPLNQKEEEAFSRFNELLDKGGSEPFSIRDLEDPITKKIWLESVKRQGLLKEDTASASGANTTETMDSDTEKTQMDTPAVPEPKASSDSVRLGQYDESDFQKAMGTTTLVNSPVTNIINNGGGDIGIETLTSIRTADITMRKLQFANLRLV